MISLAAKCGYPTPDHDFLFCDINPSNWRTNTKENISFISDPRLNCAIALIAWEVITKPSNPLMKWETFTNFVVKLRAR